MTSFFFSYNLVHGWEIVVLWGFRSCLLVSFINDKINFIILHGIWEKILKKLICFKCYVVDFNHYNIVSVNHTSLKGINIKNLYEYFSPNKTLVSAW
jgi:hypothetical protein